MKKTYWLTAVILAALLLFVGWKIFFPIHTNKPTPIKLGFIGPLTGNGAAIGQNTLMGAQIARDQINAAGGIAGRPIELIAEDAACSPKEAVAAAHKLLDIDNVAAIVGGLCSSETLAIAPLTEAAKVPQISPGSSSPDITQAGIYTFRFYPSDSFQGRDAADELVADLHMKRIAILACSDEYCSGIANVFAARATELGAAIVDREDYAPESTDLHTELTKIKASQPDAIFFPDHTDAVVLGLREIKELGISAALFGSDAWTDPKVGDTVKKLGLSARYFIPANRTLPESFTAAMRNYSGDNTIIVSAPRAYDVVTALKVAIEQVGTNGTALQNYFAHLMNYQGIADTYSMDQNGDMTDARYELKTW